MSMRRTVLLTLACLGSLRCDSSRPARHVSAYAPYWYVDDRTESVIEVKNLTSSPLELRPRLRTTSGETTDLPVVTVPPFATERVPVNPYASGGLAKPAATARRHDPRWGDGSRPNGRLGSAELQVVSPPDAPPGSFAAWVFLKDRDEGLGLVSTFHEVPSARSTETVLEGLWWLPFEETRAYFALHNAAREPIDLQVELFDESGEKLRSQSIALAGGASELVDIVELLDTPDPPVVGGVRFRFASEPRQPMGIVARGLLVQEKRGFVTPLNLYEARKGSSSDSPATLQSPLAYFGRFGELVPGSEDILSPHLLLFNTSERKIALQGSVEGKGTKGEDRSFPLKPVVIEPHAALAIDLGEERQAALAGLADGPAGLELSHDGGSTDLVAELVNVSPSGSLAVYDRMRNLAFLDATEQAAISFSLEDGHHSYLVLKNTTDRPQSPRVLLDYDAGRRPYEVADVVIPPRQVATIDIEELRDGEVPDRFGLTLPKTVEFGGARVFGEPGAVIGSDPTVVFRLDNTSEVIMVGSCMHMVVKDPIGGGGGGPSDVICLPNLNSGPGSTDMPAEVSGSEEFVDGGTTYRWTWSTSMEPITRGREVLINSSLATVENGLVDIVLTSTTFVEVTCNNCNIEHKCSNVFGQPVCSDTQAVDPPGLPSIGTSATTSVVNKVLTIEGHMSVNTGGVLRTKGPFKFVFECSGIS